MDKAQWHELLDYALNRPLAFAVLQLAGHLGAMVRFPGVGHIVSEGESVGVASIHYITLSRERKINRFSIPRLST